MINDEYRYKGGHELMKRIRGIMVCWIIAAMMSMMVTPAFAQEILSEETQEEISDSAEEPLEEIMPLLEEATPASECEHEYKCSICSVYASALNTNISQKKCIICEDIQ